MKTYQIGIHRPDGTPMPTTACCMGEANFWASIGYSIQVY